MLSRSISIRIDDKLLYKLRYIAKYNIRSINGQIVVLIRKCIEDFEKQYGEILINSEK